MFPRTHRPVEGFDPKNPVHGGTPRPEAPPPAPAAEDDEVTLLTEAAKHLDYIARDNPAVASLVQRIETYLAKEQSEKPEAEEPAESAAPMPMMG